MNLQSTLPLRRICGRYILFKRNDSTGQRHILELNDTAAMLWQRFAEHPNVTPSLLADALMEEYDIERDLADADATCILESWKQAGFCVD
ncbi:MAG: PqqD family protein [Bacteroidales bacterium]|nr:PqqD family protein [Candidatus Physcousia equi]